MSDRRGEVSTLQPEHDGCQVDPNLSWAALSTPIGEVRVFWREAGLLRLCLPGDASRADGFSAAVEAPLPQGWGELLHDQLQALASGSRADFREVPLDLGALTPFQREVLAACAEIPWGQVVTYGELAKRTGRKVTASRAVGKALSLNPVPLVVPCHRVMGASGKLVGFTAPGGVDTKRQLLTLEGAL
jgi:methylated-DNA-[protein]-cysteine S-methyltransferase